MDISQAAFGLDMRSASRIYFISPVLNPQVEAQAIGRVRRISQSRQVTVETLVLRGSLEEVIVERSRRMTQADHKRCKSILDDRPIYDWILNARILPLPKEGADVAVDGQEDGPSQMAPLKTPQYIFGRGFGRVVHPDEGLLMDGLPQANGTAKVMVNCGSNRHMNPKLNGSSSLKRSLGERPETAIDKGASPSSTAQPQPKRAKVRVRFATPEPDI